jgi:hypothetical protein
VWAMTKREVRWVRSELGTKALIDEAAALRCGLDAHLWDDENTAEGCCLVGGEPKRDLDDSVSCVPIACNEQSTTRAFLLACHTSGPLTPVCEMELPA